MKKSGMSILIIGVLLTVMSGIDFITKDNIVQIGKIEITKNSRHNVLWSPILGIFIIALGVGVYLFGNKKGPSLKITK